MSNNRGLAMLCVITALGCALIALLRARDARVATEAPAPAVEAAVEATAQPVAGVNKFTVSLYAEGNVPYAFDPQRDAPSLPGEAAIESVVEAQLDMVRKQRSEGIDEDALREKFRAQIEISESSYEPTIRAYLVPGSQTAVIVFPGGGYHMLSTQNEGSEIAHALNDLGVSAFVVKYRIAPCDYRAILSDGQRAVRHVRSHAAEYGVDPEKIAVCGFSQGGHLALMTCQHPEFEIDDPSYHRDAVDEVSSLPNACVVCYGVATLEKGHTFEVGAEIFTHGDDSLRATYSAENGVTAGMCPSFIWLNRDDLLVPVEGAYRLAEACAAREVPYEFHVFETGGHGCGLGEGLPCGQWLPLAFSWLNRTL